MKLQHRGVRIAALFLAAVLLGSLFTGAHVLAEGQEKVLGTIRAVIVLPDGWTETASDGLLSAENADGLTFTFRADESDLTKSQWNFTLFEAAERKRLAEKMVKSLEEGGYTGVSYDVFERENEAWLVFDWTEEKIGLYGRQYYSVINGRALTLAFVKKSALAEEDLGQALEIINSLSFSEYEEKKPVERDYTSTFIWIGVIIAAGLFTYWLTTRKGRRQ